MNILKKFIMILKNYMMQLNKEWDMLDIFLRHYDRYFDILTY